MAALSMFLVIAGAVLYLIGGFWLLIKAFQESILWGLGSLFIPLVGLFFAILHWADCKKPFLYGVLGLGLIIVGAAIAPPPDIPTPKY